MKLIFEKSKKGAGSSVLPPCDVPEAGPSAFARKRPARLPSLDENSLSRHYSALAKRSFGVNDGFYPLGSCTMKYNPKINEELAALPGFRDIHPLQPAHTVKGCLKLLDLASRYLREITGMDAMSFQPAAGAQGEFTGLLLFAAWHRSRGDTGRTTVIVPDSAHGTNPASAAMAGFQVRNIPSGPDGCVDLEALRAALGPDTAGLMLTNPNTLGLFDPRILEITGIVHQAGGLCYYDGANLNAVMGITRPGDMGFDAVHLNLHKSFSTPHGGGGPGSGAVGCKDFLAPFLPLGAEIPGSSLDDIAPAERALRLEGDPEAHPLSIGRVRAFYGNFLVVVKAAAYLLSLGKEGIPAAARDAVLNANYLMEKIRDRFPPAYPGPCMHEFVISLEELKRSHGVSALDLAKALQDRGMHPPTIYFPLIVHEAMMVEPTETESKETLEAFAAALKKIAEEARINPALLKEAPHHTPVGRLDETAAARNPVLRYRRPEG